MAKKQKFETETLNNKTVYDLKGYKFVLFFLIILNYNVNNVYNNIIVFEEIGTRDVAMAVPVPGTWYIILFPL